MIFQILQLMTTLHVMQIMPLYGRVSILYYICTIYRVAGNCTHFTCSKAKQT